MLEEIIKAARIVEKPVLLFDEGIHRIVNRGIGYLENRGMRNARDKITNRLGYLTMDVTTVAFLATISEPLYKQNINFLRWWEVMATDITLLFWPAFEEIFLGYSDGKPKTKPNDGTVGKVSSFVYESVTRFSRPYLLGTSVYAITYGILNKDLAAFGYGVSSLPWYLSFYTRDDKTGGLFQKIGTWFKETFGAKLPLPNPI